MKKQLYRIKRSCFKVNTRVFFPEQLLKELCELRLRKEGEPRLTKKYSGNLIEDSFFNDGKKPAEQ